MVIIANMKKVLIIDSRPFGMFSIFLHTIDCLKWCEENEHIPYVRWNTGRIDTNLYRKGAKQAIITNNPKFIEDKTNFVTKNSLVSNTRPCLYAQQPEDNVWNYYFDPIEIDKFLESQYQINVADIFMCGELDFDLDNKFLIKNLHTYDSLKLWSIEDKQYLKNHRLEVNKIINRYVNIKKNIIDKVDKFYSNKFKDLEFSIGVHVRGTDKRTEYPYKELVIKHYIDEIQKIININNGKKYKIYIASDNNESIVEIANHFGKQNIICHASIRMNSYTSTIPIHLSSGIDHKKHGEETLIEMLLLSKCDYIIGTDSNFTAAACYFNPEAELIYLDRKNGV